MAVTLNATVGGIHSDGTNSYIDVAYADDYFANHWLTANATAWDAVDDAPKANVLIAACRILETCRFTNPVHHADSHFHGYYDRARHVILSLQLTREPLRYFLYQLLQFPRNLDIDITTGALYIPEPVKMAQCEQAIYMLTVDQTPLINRLQGVVQDTISIGREQIHLSQEYGGVLPTLLAPTALEMIKPFLVFNTRTRRA